MPKLNQLFEGPKPQFSSKLIGYGRNALQTGKTIVDFPRIPFGSFPIDFAMAGGLICNTPVAFMGPPNAGKGTAWIMLARNLTKTCMNIDCMKPLSLCKCAVKKKQKTFLLHTEGMPPEPTWFKIMNYDYETELIVGLPDDGEQGCDMLEAALRSDDCGLAVVDSLQNLVPREELTCAYGDAKYALQARLFARLFRRLGPLLINEWRRGHLVGLIFINQVRANIGGGLFEPTESISGGWAHKHAYRLLSRINQLTPDKASGEMDTDDNIKRVLKFSMSMLGPNMKQQTLLLQGKCEYRVVVRDFKGWSAGQSYDAASAWAKAKELGVIETSTLGSKKFGLKGSKMGWRNEAEFVQMMQTGIYEGMEGADALFRRYIIQVARARVIHEIEKNNVKVIRTVDEVDVPAAD